VWIEPWQQVTTAEMNRVYRAEHARLLTVLDWDTAATWTSVERARVTGAAAGLVARAAAGTIVGWTFAVERDDELQVGAFTATAAAREPLLAALLASPAARRAARLRLFGATDAPRLAAALRARGFLTGGYDYLTAAATRADRPVDPPGIVRWRPGDLHAAAMLLRAAYADLDPLRPFGTTARVDDWLDYVIGLTGTTGCGVFAPDLSAVVRGPHGTLDALAIVTRLGPAVAHLAQLAVAPARRGRGLGRRVLDAVRTASADAGLGTMTLLVSGDNHAARALYRASGFRYAASFLSAVTPGEPAIAVVPARPASATA
jgi:ribosomal protein S18 acetylase RimI-like enzyme